MHHNDSASLSDKIREEALRLGFLDCGFSKVHSIEERESRYMDWLKQGHHATMDYMERNIDKRLNPALLVDDAKTVISLLYNYYSSESLTGSPLKIAKYAYGKDYHDVVKDKLKQLAQFIQGQVSEVNQRCFVDSAPILERDWAQISGLGWIGKNSCLISRKYGSFFFIAEIVTTLALEPTEHKINDYCGSCSRCIDACPTQAITQDRSINSNRCISYQTIENKGDIPTAMKGKFQNNIFGCDICQDVCPWNHKSIAHSEPLFQLNSTIKNMTEQEWQNLDEETFKLLFKGSAVKRTKFTGLKRNILFISNSLT